MINQAPEHEPLKVYAAKHPDNSIRRTSSSGGVFTAIAEKVIANGGVVFGARFNADWSVEHAYTETVEGLAEFRGSKYVQSRVGDTFLQVEQFLKQGREVLFSGTPCQVAGLKRFLRKAYTNLIAIDIVCHSVPSPGLWRRYLTENFANEQITAVRFRDKVSGWKGYSCSVATDRKTYTCHHDDSLWMRAFLKDLTVRPSCFRCPAKCNRSSADITLGDLWGIMQLCPEIDDDRGITLVIEHNDRNLSDITSQRELTFADVARYNPALVKSVVESSDRAEFQASTGKSLTKAMRSYTHRPLFLTLRIALSRLIRKTLHR
jgi:hypothetical protein